MRQWPVQIGLMNRGIPSGKTQEAGSDHFQMHDASPVEKGDVPISNPKYLDVPGGSNYKTYN